MMIKELILNLCFALGSSEVSYCCLKFEVYPRLMLEDNGNNNSFKVPHSGVRCRGWQGQPRGTYM